MTRALSTPRSRLAAGAAAALVLAIALLLWRNASEGDGAARSGGSGSTTPAAPANGSGGSATNVQRSTGPGTCAFLSVDEVKQATSAATVELRQAVSPAGKPGCEWVLGDERRRLVLELQPGRTASTLPPGEDVSGPWDSARWVPSTRTLYVVVRGQELSLVATDGDPARARTDASAVAALVAART